MHTKASYRSSPHQAFHLVFSLHGRYGFGRLTLHQLWVFRLSEDSQEARIEDRG
jgi:hypothetical protein